MQWRALGRGGSVTRRTSRKVQDGAAVEDDAVEEQPAVQRRSVLLQPVGVEGAGEGAAAAEEADGPGEESHAHTAPQVRPTRTQQNPAEP